MHFVFHFHPSRVSETGYIFAEGELGMIVKLFGITKEITGCHSLSIDDAKGTINTVGDLKVWLSKQYPSLRELKSLLVAVDSEYADDSHFIKTDSEIALIPPVSGG